ncbi:MAG: type II secretion system protein [Polyangia bacterium]
MARQRGFTLVELMVVVAMIGVIAAVALTSFSANKSRFQVDNWVATNRDAIMTASRRAITTHQPFMVVFTQTSVQWCQVTNIGTAPTYTDAQTSCAAVPVTAEKGRLVSVANGTDAYSALYAGSTDTLDGNGVYASPPTSALTTQWLYFGRNGTTSTSMKNVLGIGLPDPATSTGVGFTLYIRRKSVDTIDLRRRIAVYGMTSKVRTVSGY